MDDPFNSFNHRCCDNKVDEVVDGVWYKNCARMCEDSKWRKLFSIGINFLL